MRSIFRMKMKWMHSILLGLNITTLGFLFYHHTSECQAYKKITQLAHQISTQSVPTLSALKHELNHIYQPGWSIWQFLGWNKYGKWNRVKKQFIQYHDLRGIAHFKDEVRDAEIKYKIENWLENAKKRLKIDFGKN